MATDPGKRTKGIKHILIKISRIVAWMFFSVVVLLIAIALLIRVPAIQNTIAQKAISFLEEKIKTNVELKRITIDFPKKIVIEGLYLEDRQRDTLLYTGRLGVDIGMLALLNNEISLGQVELENTSASIRRTLPDSSFNFDYIVDSFAGSDTAAVTVDTTSSSWKVTLGSVSFRDVSLSYQDEVTPMRISSHIGEFDADTDDFDPMSMIFLLDEIRLVDSFVAVDMRSDTTASPETATADSTTAIQAGFNELVLSNVNVHYADSGTHQQLDATIGGFQSEADDIDLDGQRIALDELLLENSSVRFQQRTSPTDTSAVAGSDPVAFTLSPWAVSIETLGLKSNTIEYINLGAQPATAGFDPNHIRIESLVVAASNVAVDTTSASMDLERLAFSEQSGIQLRNMSGDIRVEYTGASLRNFILEYGDSRIAIDARAAYPALSRLPYELAALSGEISVHDSHLALSDILAVQPQLLDSLPVTVPANVRLTVSFDASGSADELTVRQLELQSLDSTYLLVSGSAKGLQDLNAAEIDVHLDQLYTSLTDLHTLLPDSLLPDSLGLPSYLALKGDAKGTLRKPELNLTLDTDRGTIGAVATLDLAEVPLYDTKVTARNIQAGRLSGMQGLGNLSFDLAVAGKGFDMETIDTKVDLLVKELVYNNYRFADFKLNGTVVRYLFDGTASMDDENLAFELDADLDYNGDIPVYKAEFDLKNLNLKELNLSERPLRARLTVDVDLTTSDFQVMNGHLDIRKVAVYNGEKLYAVDSMLFASLDQSGHSQMSIRSDILSGDFEGTFNVFSISQKLTDHFERYFSPIEKKAEVPGAPQNFTFDVKIKNTDLITEVLVPELEPFTPGVIRGAFDSQQDQLDLVFRMPELKYGEVGVDSLILLVNSDPEELRWLFKLDRLIADTIVVDEVNLQGRVAHDSIHTTFNILDSLDQKKYAIGASILRDDKMMRIHLDDEDFFLNYSKWDVPAGNYLLVGNGVVASNDFGIVKENQKVSLVGDTRKDPAVSVRFDQLELGNFTRIISGIVPASGELNGDFKFTTGTSGDFSSKLSINGLTVLQKPLGDLTLAIDHSQATYQVALNLRGNRTDLRTTGTYGNSELRLVADINQLSMEAVQAFSVGQLTGASGIITGKLEVNGNPSHPDITGNLRFVDAGFVSTFLNSRYNMKNEAIAISNDRVTFDNFTITDDQGNAAQLKGRIDITSYTDPKFDLTVNTKNFQVLNTQEGDNELFYGLVKIDASARVSGSTQSPKADFKLGFSDDTNFTYVVPTTERAVMEAEGIVQFIDRDAQGDPFLQSLEVSDTLRTSFGGVEVSAVIDLSDQEILNVVIDPATGDKLTVQGNASLTFDMTSSGNMNLSGRYEITTGSYNLSFYNLVKRKFDIEKGSSITWSGDPLNATMDIRASNLVETSPIDLVSNQASSSDAANSFTQRLPFLVYLNIKGQLLAPQISFQLDMPADKRNANGGIYYSRLQDINSRESDLNKQVFALLILKRFIADNPFESSSGGGVTNTARTSVSRMLSEQLNRLSQNVKGVELSFDIKSYEQAGVEGTQATTRAQLGVSKSLFGNRLVVKLSGNVDIEGEEAGSNNVTDYIGDLALEYKMTADGRFRVTGFRNSNYDMIDGELIETGAGLIYIKDYNTLRELFKANEKAID